jgi:hypothetical protein
MKKGGVFMNVNATSTFLTKPQAAPKGSVATVNASTLITVPQLAPMHNEQYLMAQVYLAQPQSAAIAQVAPNAQQTAKPHHHQKQEALASSSSSSASKGTKISIVA